MTDNRDNSDQILRAITHLKVLDPMQIRPIIKSTNKTNPFIAQLSLGGGYRLFQNNSRFSELAEIFRSSAGSMDFVISKFYNDKLVYHRSTNERAEPRSFVVEVARRMELAFPNAGKSNKYLEYNKPYVIVDLPDAVTSMKGSSMTNQGMIKPTIELISMITELPNSGTPFTQSVISPYNAMV